MRHKRCLHLCSDSALVLMACCCSFNPEGGGQQFVEHPEAEEAEDEDEIEAMLNGGKRRRGSVGAHAQCWGFMEPFHGWQA